jgi:hypothetical protein
LNCFDRLRPIKPHAEEHRGCESEKNRSDHLPNAAFMPIQTAPTKPVAMTVITALNV